MILTSVLSLVGIGGTAAAILAVASYLLRMEENPLIEEVTEALPGANCGACGFAGCEAYAVAVVTSDTPVNLCLVGGSATAEKIGKISGKAAEALEKNISFRRCLRNTGKVQHGYDYIGSLTCAGSSMLEGGPFACSWACIGFGDCVRACQFDAMYLQDGMVEIDPDKCVSCGKCISTCPRNVLQMLPASARVAIHCGTNEKLKDVSSVCEIGCISCLRCIKACPAKAISVPDGSGRLEIDHKACTAYGEDCKEACVTTCPRKILLREQPGACDTFIGQLGENAVPLQMQ